jgi:hypothetical protein
MAPQAAGPALAAPAPKAAIAAPAAPAVDDAYAHEVADTPPAIQAQAPASKPVVAPVRASDELAAKLDDLFNE